MRKEEFWVVESSYTSDKDARATINTFTRCYGLAACNINRPLATYQGAISIQPRGRVPLLLDYSEPLVLLVVSILALCPSMDCVNFLSTFLS
jgi:hypothetical protein